MAPLLLHGMVGVATSRKRVRLQQILGSCCRDRSQRCWSARATWESVPRSIDEHLWPSVCHWSRVFRRILLDVRVSLCRSDLPLVGGFEQCLAEQI